MSSQTAMMVWSPTSTGDPEWDAQILDDLAVLHRALVPLTNRLTALFTRFAGYDSRFGAALQYAWSGGNEWVDGSGIVSCHRVWFQLHEDLVATKGIDRSTER